jgi:hypothetical protein
MSKVARLECHLRNHSDSSGLAIGLDERAVFIESRRKDSVCAFWGIETIAAGLAKVKRTFASRVKTIECSADLQLSKKRFPPRNVSRRFWVFAGEMGHAAPCSP